MSAPQNSMQQVLFLRLNAFIKTESYIESKHSYNFSLYFSLKPENILIDNEGYAVLTDFGLSKDNLVGKQLTNSFCGTVEYIAPEIIKKQSYGKACDWWSFGCVLYEMLTGLPPFYNTDRSCIIGKILEEKSIKFPDFISAEAKDLIRKLLRKDPSSRLGSSQRDIKKIKDHAFFECIDWTLMEKK